MRRYVMSERVSSLLPDEHLVNGATVYSTTTGEEYRVIRWTPLEGYTLSKIATGKQPETRITNAEIGGFLADGFAARVGGGPM